MKKIYSLLTMLLLATALQAATNSEPNNLQVASVSATPDDGNQEGYYNLTVNVNATDTTLADIKILYRTDEQFYWLHESNINKYTEITNHNPTFLPSGNYYIALMSNKGNRDEYTLLETWEVQLSSDQTIDLNFHTLTVDFDLPEGAEDRFYLEYNNLIYYNHSSFEAPEGSLKFYIYDKNNENFYSPWSCYVLSDQTTTIPFHTLTVSTNALENIMNVSEIRVYWYDYPSYPYYYTIDNNGSIVLPPNNYHYNYENTYYKYDGKYFVKIVDIDSEEVLQSKEITLDSDQTVNFNFYKLTVNLNTTDTSKYMLIYSGTYSDVADYYFMSNFYDCEAKTIVNHSTVSLFEGEKIYVGLYDKEKKETISCKEVIMDSDQTVDFNFNTITVNLDASNTDNLRLIYSLDKLSNGYISLYDVKTIENHASLSFLQGTIIYVGVYDNQLGQVITYKKVVMDSDQTEDTSLDFKIDKLSIVCRDKNGDVAPDISLKLTTNKSSGYSYTTDNNGRVETYALEGDTIRISMEDNNFDVSNYIVIMNGNKDISLSVPNKISFKLYVDGKPSDDGRIYSADNQRMTYNSDEKGNYSLRYDGKFPLRLFVDGLFGTYFECDEGFVPGYFTPTDGCTVRVASVRVESDGKGLVFPRNDFRPQQIYKMFVDNVVRLAAIPVGNSEFINWEINGKTYSQPMIDYTVGEDEVTAIAHFSGEITTGVKGVKAPTTEQITVSIEGGTLRLPEFIEGDASFYSVDGRLVKQVGVVGDRIVISDLPAGAYVLTIGVEGRTLSARFVKP